MDPDAASWKRVAVVDDLPRQKQADTLLNMHASRSLGRSASGRDLPAASSGRYLAAESADVQQPPKRFYSSQNVPEEDEIETVYSNSPLPSQLPRGGNLFPGHKIDVLHALQEAPSNSNHTAQQRHKDGCSPLHLAANHGNYELVKMLVSSAQLPDVNARAKDQSTVIMKPAEKGFSMIVEYLLENNANPNIADHRGHTPLMKASSKGHKDVVRVLLEHGADVNITSSKEDSTSALNEAVIGGHTEVVPLLVKALSQSIIKNQGLYTCKTSEDVRRLVKNGAKVDQQRGDRSTPLMVHAEAGRTEVVKELIVQGSPLDTQDQSGMTALMRAAQKGQLRVVKVLVENESILDIKCKKRKTALMYAIEGGGHTAVVKELCIAGADVSIRDRVRDNISTKKVEVNGQTAADLAESMGHAEVLAQLRQRRSSQAGVTLASTSDPFLECIGRYLSNDQAQGQKMALEKKSTKSPEDVLVPAKLKQSTAPDETSIMRKELDKAYARIAALEERIQELTLQTPGQEVSRTERKDDEISSLPHEYLVEEYRKLKELKKKANHFASEARQTAQKLSVENFRLKEELSRQKHANELHWKNVLGDVEQQLDISAGANKRAEEKARIAQEEYAQLMSRVVELQPTNNSLETLSKCRENEEITPQGLYGTIFKGKKSIELQFAMVAIGGLPFSGKTSLFKSLYGRDVTPRAVSNHMHRSYERHIDGLDVYELAYSKDPVTETRDWFPATGEAWHYYMIAMALAKECVGTNKFPRLTAEGSQQLKPFKDVHLNKHFRKVFKEVGDLLPYLEKRGFPSKLLREPKFVLMNVWDIGVHKALYEVLPLLALACGRLVLVDVLDLVRDAENLACQPEFADERYKQDESGILMKLRSRLHYYVRIAGLTKSVKGECPSTLLVATHKDKFPDLDQAEHTRKNLESVVWQKAVDTGISEVLYPQLLAVNALDQGDGHTGNDHNDGGKGDSGKGDGGKGDGGKGDGGKGDGHQVDGCKVRHTIEKMINEDKRFELNMPLTWMFLRSTLYNYPHVYITWSKFDKMAVECGLNTDDEKLSFLKTFTHAGSLLYYPDLQALKENIVLSPEGFLKDLEGLYYPKMSSATSVEEHQEEISKGILCGNLAQEIWKESSPFYLQLLQDAGLAVNISDASLYKTTCNVCSKKQVTSDCFFMPSLRTEHKDQLPSPNSDSLFVTFNSEYVPTDVQALFAFHLKKELKDIQLEFTEEYNTTVFTLPVTSNQDGISIHVIVHGDVIEMKINNSENTIGVCSKLKTICVQILEGVIQYFPRMEYELAFPCPMSESNVNRRKIHYLHFHPVASNTDRLFCMHCRAYITLSKGRQRWLKGEYTGPLTVTVIENDHLKGTEIDTLQKSLSELDYSEMVHLMGLHKTELKILQGVERSQALSQVVKKWQSLSPLNTKQHLAKILLRSGHYYQALQLDAKLLDVNFDEPEEQLSTKELATLSTHVHDWRALAQELGVQDVAVEQIIKQYHNSKERCYELLRISQPSRKMLVTALGSPRLQYHMLAGYLETGFNEAAYN